MDSDEAAARERLGFNFGALLAQSNALLTRPETRVALVERLKKKRPYWLVRLLPARLQLSRSWLAFAVLKKISLNNFTPSAERLPSWRQESCPYESESLS